MQVEKWKVEFNLDKSDMVCLARSNVSIDVQRNPSQLLDSSNTSRSSGKEVELTKATIPYAGVLVMSLNVMLQVIKLWLDCI